MQSTKETRDSNHEMVKEENDNTEQSSREHTSEANLGDQLVSAGGSTNSVMESYFNEIAGFQPTPDQ